MPREEEPYRVPIIRYVDRDGRRCKSTGPGAKPENCLSKKYYANIGGQRVPLGTANIGQAWETYRRLRRETEEATRGIVDNRMKEVGRPIGEQVEEWIAVLRAESRSGEQHLQRIRSDVIRVITLAKWRRLADVRREDCLRVLSDLRLPPKRDDAKPVQPKKKKWWKEDDELQEPQGMSAQTRNHVLSHCRQFIRWAHDAGRMYENPLASIKPLNVETDRRHSRRMPTDEEIDMLFKFLRGKQAKPGLIGPTNREGKSEGVRLRNGMTGPHRALGYRLVMATGLRASELRSLSHESFDLKKGTVTVSAAYSKHRRKDEIPLPTWLKKELKAWFTKGGRCWETLPANCPGHALRRDLRNAGVKYMIRASGDKLYFDFHALRHWYVTKLANQPGISPKTLMAMSRHSTPALALKIYAKAQEQDKRRAAANIPPPGKSGKRPK